MAHKKDLRGGIAEMRSVARLLSAWADDMERSLDKREAIPAEQPEALPKPTVAESAPAPAVSADQLRSILAAKCAAGFRTQVQALINSFGASRFSGVAQEHYPALLDAVKGLDEGGDPDAG